MSKTTTTGRADKALEPLRAMTDDEVMAAALSDPDAQPLTPDDFKRMKRVARAKIIRQALGLTQEEFAARFRIPLGTLRDWEQGAAEPDAAAKAYLHVIARNPKAVIRRADGRIGDGLPERLAYYSVATAATAATTAGNAFGSRRTIPSRFRPIGWGSAPELSNNQAG